MAPDRKIYCKALPGLLLMQVARVDSLPMSGMCKGQWPSSEFGLARIKFVSYNVAVLDISQKYALFHNITHLVRRDAIKAILVRESRNQIALVVDLQVSQRQFAAELVKARVSPDCMIAWHDSKIFDCSVYSSTLHAKGFVGGVLLGLSGSIEQFFTGGVKNKRWSNDRPFAIIYGKELNT